MSDKPLKPKPIFYATCFEGLQKIARELGYNLLIHGSLNRDFDLVAVPWVDRPSPEMVLIRAFDVYFRGKSCDDARYYLFQKLPGGRNSYVINLNRREHGGEEDKEYYLDISITPLVL